MTSDRRQQLTEKVEVLKTSHDREALEEAAKLLAASDDPAFLKALGDFLGRGEALARLDDLGDPSFKTYHLARVLRELEQQPSAATAELCLRLVHEPDFLADDDRKIFLLPALAAVKPMSEQTVEVFRRTNAEGYENLNVRLLVMNGSPLALALFEGMIRDEESPAERRVDGLHAAVLPYRTELAVLRSVDRLLAGDLAEPVRIGAVETVFDYRSREWFGPAKSPPAPQPWESAATEALRFVLGLGDRVTARGGLPPTLAEAVARTVRLVREILALRSA